MKDKGKMNEHRKSNLVVSPEADQKTSKHTAIISDLHLCEAQVPVPEFPLWKKFKTREFFFDERFADFLGLIQFKARGDAVELILNGDIFDFDSVMRVPEYPLFRVNWLERRRGLFPRAERARFKIKVILDDHKEFIEALADFVRAGHRVVFVIGNHDLELHFTEVQEEIRAHLRLDKDEHERVIFADWFYISNQDTLVEHGNQYDPYCMCEDPINPFLRGYNFISIKLPFGNLACRYIMNGMGFFNPHVDSNYIMTLKQYLYFFFKYVARAQPDLMITWFWGSVVTLIHSFIDRLRAPLRNPLTIEERIDAIASRANATPRMVRELKELFVAPAASQPFLLARELWLDRAFIAMLVFIFIFQVMLWIKTLFDVSMFWAFVPLFLLLPFFIFYSRSVTSLVSSYKEPDDRVLAMASAITGVKRIVFGHTHRARHEIIGAVEHLNSGCWSPAFLDVECTKPVGHKSFVWISPSDEGGARTASLLKFEANTRS